jgi:hypothetical protein
MSINVEDVRTLISKLGEAIGVEMDPPKDRETRSPKELFDEAVLEVAKAVEAGDTKIALEKLELLKAMAHEQVGGRSLPEQNDQTTAAKEYSDKTTPMRDVVQPMATTYSSNGLQKAFNDLLMAFEELSKAKGTPKKKPMEEEKGCPPGGKKKKTEKGDGFDAQLAVGHWPRDLAAPEFREDVKKADPDGWGDDPWRASF